MRRGQAGDGTRRRHPAIYDEHEDIGPIAGIAAAQAAHPAHAWLVVACDLPFLTDTSLAALVASRDGRPVIAYRSAHDGLPEPLCAIYEPESRVRDTRVHRQRAALPDVNSCSAPASHCWSNPSPRRWTTSTRRAELERAGAACWLSHEHAMTHDIEIQYFACCASRRAAAANASRPTRRRRPIFTRGAQRRMASTLPVAMLRVAVNDEFCDWSQRLRGRRSRRVHPARRGGLMRPFSFSEQPLDAGELSRRSSAIPAPAATRRFEGWVRDHNDGRQRAAPRVRGVRVARRARGRTHRRGGDRQVRRSSAPPACIASATSRSANSRCGSA